MFVHLKSIKKAVRSSILLNAQFAFATNRVDFIIFYLGQCDAWQKNPHWRYCIVHFIHSFQLKKIWKNFTMKLISDKHLYIYYLFALDSSHVCMRCNCLYSGGTKREQCKNNHTILTQCTVQVCTLNRFGLLVIVDLLSTVFVTTRFFFLKIVGVQCAKLHGTIVVRCMSIQHINFSMMWTHFQFFSHYFCVWTAIYNSKNRFEIAYKNALHNFTAYLKLKWSKNNNK